MKTNGSGSWREILIAAVMLITAWVCGHGATGADAADWPNYRGVNYDGISLETNWKSDWGDAGPKTLWRGSVGVGYSSFAVSEGRAYTMGNHTEKKDGGKAQETDAIYCLDALTGREIWKHSYPCALQPLYYEGGTLSTPSVDGSDVYTLSKMGDLFCLDAATGKVKWEVNADKELGFELPTWSFSSSPLIVGDKLILNLGSAGVALDKHSGKILWENGKDV